MINILILSRYLAIPRSESSKAGAARTEPVNLRTRNLPLLMPRPKVATFQTIGELMQPRPLQRIQTTGLELALPPPPLMKMVGEQLRRLLRPPTLLPPKVVRRPVDERVAVLRRKRRTTHSLLTSISLSARRRKPNYCLSWKESERPTKVLMRPCGRTQSKLPRMTKKEAIL
jgi:hypothetical protein